MVFDGPGRRGAAIRWSQKTPVISSCHSDNGPDLPGCVTIFYRPVDRFSLRFEGGKDVGDVIFDYILFDGRILGAGLNVDARHRLLRRYLLLGMRMAQR
jgi:hypothetical protein